MPPTAPKIILELCEAPLGIIFPIDVLRKDGSRMTFFDQMHATVILKVDSDILKGLDHGKPVYFKRGNETMVALLQPCSKVLLVEVVSAEEKRYYSSVQDAAAGTPHATPEQMRVQIANALKRESGIFVPFDTCINYQIRFLLVKKEQIVYKKRKAPAFAPPCSKERKKDAASDAPRFNEKEIQFAADLIRFRKGCLTYAV
jgi:hypothetical protein